MNDSDPKVNQSLYHLEAYLTPLVCVCTFSECVTEYITLLFMKMKLLADQWENSFITASRVLLAGNERDFPVTDLYRWIFDIAFLRNDHNDYSLRNFIFDLIRKKSSNTPMIDGQSLVWNFWWDHCSRLSFGIFQNEDKICVDTKFNALKPSQLFTLNIDSIRVIQTQCLKSIKMFSEQNTYLRKEEKNNESEIENKE